MRKVTENRTNWTQSSRIHIFIQLRDSLQAIFVLQINLNICLPCCKKPAAHPLCMTNIWKSSNRQVFRGTTGSSVVWPSLVELCRAHRLIWTQVFSAGGEISLQQSLLLGQLLTKPQYGSVLADATSFFQVILWNYASRLSTSPFLSLSTLLLSHS